MNSKINIYIIDENEEANKDFIQHLHEYQSIVSTCIGPINGSMKLFSKSSDLNDLQMTSSSKNLFNILYDLRHLKTNESQKEKWQFDLIKSVISNSHFDHFYDAGLFACHLVNEFLILENSYNFNKQFVDSSLKSIVDHLHSQANQKESLIVVKIDLNNIQFIRKLISTCLNSKCLIKQIENDQGENDEFINLCLKAFISSFEGETRQQFSEILYLFNENNSFHLSDSRLFNGILFETDTTNICNQLQNQANDLKTSLKCVLLDSSFSGDFDHLNNQEFQLEINSNELENNRTVFLMLEKLIQTADYFIDNFKVKVFLFQKVIHPSLKCHLTKKGIIYVDRLSIMLTKSLERLTGCKVVKSSWNLKQFDENTFGYLSSISIEKILNKSYIHFQNSSASIQTFFVCVLNESLKDEIQYLLKVAQATFQRTIFAGFAVCGGACFYTYCMCFIWRSLASQSKLVNKNRAVLFRQMNVIKSVLFSFAKNLLDESVEWKLDLSSGHLFKTYDLNCNCGLFKLKELTQTHIDLNDMVNFSLIDFVNILVPNEHLLRISTNFIDCYHSKINAFMLAREILSSILQIGVLIHN